MDAILSIIYLVRLGVVSRGPRLAAGRPLSHLGSLAVASWLLAVIAGLVLNFLSLLNFVKKRNVLPIPLISFSAPHFVLPSFTWIDLVL